MRLRRRLPLVALLLAGCAAASPPPDDRPSAWDVTQDVVTALPPEGQQKWRSLTEDQRKEIAGTAEPFLLKWRTEGDPLALDVVLKTFSAMWNAAAPQNPVHCTLVGNIVCY